MSKLGVNIDHVATLRQARGGRVPDPLDAAALCEHAGVDSIVAHLREDRRHINDSDVRRLRKAVRVRFNLEMSINPAIVDIACSIKPDEATLVPERRQELTTEGGLDVVSYKRKISAVITRLKKKGITVSLFVNPEKKQVDAAAAVGADFIEIHTGKYADSTTVAQQKRQLYAIAEAAGYAHWLGLRVNAGHGLNYANVSAVARIEEIEELNIGHSIISRAVAVGLERAVREMKALIHG